MSEQEAAERLCALLNEIAGAGHKVDLWDFFILIAGTVEVKYSPWDDITFEVK